MLLSRRTSDALAPLFRAYATTSTTGPTQPNATSPLSNVKPIRMQKAEGSIADVFTSLTGEKAPPLPPRFADLKNLLWKESLVQSWREVLSELEVAVQRVSQQGGNVLLSFGLFCSMWRLIHLFSQIIPRLSYDDIVKGPSANQIQAIKDTGTVIVAGAVKKEVKTTTVFPSSKFNILSLASIGSVSLERIRQGLHSCQPCERYTLFTAINTLGLT